MRRLFIEVDEAAFRAIADLATAERRPTRDQAALLLEQAAKRATRRRPNLEPPAEAPARLTASGAA